MSSVAESLVARARARLDWPFLIASVLALAVLVALVLVDGQPAAAALLAFGFALGAVFLKTEFSFTASWRRLIVRGQADGFLGGLLLIAIAPRRRSFQSRRSSLASAGRSLRSGRR